jgi:hypothetical protein
MASNQEHLIKAELYLSGEMTEAEKHAFEIELTQNPELAETLALLRNMGQSLGNPKRRHLLDALAEVVEKEHSQSPGNSTNLWKSRIVYGSLALIVLLVAWFYLRPSIQIPESGQSPDPNPIQAPLPDTVPGSAPPSDDDTQRKPEPIAALDPAAFAPHPALDPLAGVHLRGSGSALQIKQPAINETFYATAGIINFIFEGSIGDEKALYLRIYNNKEVDFIANKPVFQTDMAISNSRFALKKKLKLKPGLYYIAIYQPGEEEALAIQRFYVKPR